jgi:hypothetical protein
LGTLADDYTKRKRIFATPFKYLTTRPVPAILHINRESRSIDLKHYSLEFGWEMKDTESGLEMKVAPRIYYNPCVDRVCLLGSFIDPFQEQGDENGALPWSLYTSKVNQSSLAPLSIAINLWPHEYAYGYEDFTLDSHVPEEFGFIIGSQEVKEVLLFWESGLDIDVDNILLGARNFEFVEITTNTVEGKRRERLEIGRAMLEREFEILIEFLKTMLARGDIGQAEFEEQLSPLEVRPAVKFVRLMAEGEFPSDPEC